MIKYKLFTTIFLGIFFTFTGFINAHTGTHAESHVKTWHLSEDNYTFKADYIKLKEGVVFLKDLRTGTVSEFQLTDFAMEDQLLILKRHELTAHINANLAKPIPNKGISSGLKISKGNASLGLVLLLLLTVYLVFYWSNTKRKNLLVTSLFSLLIFITCSGEEDPVPDAPVDTVVKFTLQVTSELGGSVSSSGGTYDQGRSISVTATPDPEYVFVNWSNGSTDNPVTVLVNSDLSIAANFEKRKYPLTITIAGEGSVSEEIISAGKSTTEYSSGSIIQLTASPTEGWSFSGWSGTVSSTENPIQLTVDEAKSITSTFQEILQDNTDNTSTDSTLLSTIQSHFAAYTGVSISADEEYFYIASYSWPEHDMGNGITSWQEQVPIPQNYQGENSWAIPLNPVMADAPLDTSEHLLKGALAVAVNGVPIFNVLNNRSENAFLIGELDNWGGHFGRGDDYHYHMIPTHLEDEIGTDTPLAYALDGFPVYGYTDEALDDAFGRVDSDGNYRYHASLTVPYYIPLMKGEVTLDPTTTAPEDQIIPQAIQNAVRPSNTFRGVSGAVVIGITETGENAFSFEYEVSGTRYFVNYSWDDNCQFTYTYVDENGGTTNLPTNGSIDTGTGNTEIFNNVSFCADVSLGAGGSSASTNTTDDSDTSGATGSDDTIIGYSVTSTNSNFTLSSIAIDTNGALLSDYQCEEKVNGSENSIPISWSNVPEGTSSLAITIHAYTNTAVVETNSYLTLWGIGPDVTEIAYGAADDGDWFMGPNKDGAGISYTSPCNPSGNFSTYYMTIYALSETPSSLPTENSLTVDYDTLMEAIQTVTLLDSVEMEYLSGSSN
jgi:phosphatidylethanolamine-binding protein (PEBP) family uncharacterized protein